jgi:hypothetical protein
MKHTMSSQCYTMLFLMLFGALAFGDGKSFLTHSRGLLIRARVQAIDLYFTLITIRICTSYANFFQQSSVLALNTSITTPRIHAALARLALPWTAARRRLRLTTSQKLGTCLALLFLSFFLCLWLSVSRSLLSFICFLLSASVFSVLHSQFSSSCPMIQPSADV